jgi:hypothetical protein
MLALIDSDKSTMDVEKIAVHYRNWLGTPPFDIGRTTRECLGKLRGRNATASAAKQQA